MQSINTEILLKFLTGNLSTAKRRDVEKIVAEDPYYAESLNGLSIMLDELGSPRKVLQFLEEKKKNNPFRTLC